MCQWEALGKTALTRHVEEGRVPVVWPLVQPVERLFRADEGFAEFPCFGIRDGVGLLGFSSSVDISGDLVEQEYERQGRFLVGSYEGGEVIGREG